MYAVILIERDPPSYSTWSSLIKKSRIPELSVQEIVAKYKGFEGDLISFYQYRGDEKELKQVVEEYLKLKKLGNCLLLHILSESEPIPSIYKDHACQVGYDVGKCEEEWTLYSSIFHEILFGYYDDLAAYKVVLNDNLLFSDKVTAEKYVQLHNEMSAQGKNVEDYMDMIIYEVWVHKDS